MDNKLSNKDRWVLTAWMYFLVYGICLSLIGPGADTVIYAGVAMLSFPWAFALAVTISIAWAKFMDMIDEMSAKNG